MALPLSPQVFGIMAHLIEERTGLHYDLANLTLFAEKLTYRADELGFGSLLDYYYFLRYDEGGSAELRALAETLVVQETYFFREVDSLRVLATSILPNMLRVQDRARVWSAACATGEEPYTLAFLLSLNRIAERVNVVASDISERALAKARAGMYSARSVRSVPEDVHATDLLEKTGTGWRVRDAFRSCVSWHRVNLIDAEAVRALGQFDVVLCRNVLIYFADETVTRVAVNLGQTLRPGGLLVVGASESLLRFGTLFECEEHGGSFFYRKSVE